MITPIGREAMKEGLFLRISTTLSAAKSPVIALTGAIHFPFQSFEIRRQIPGSAGKMSNLALVERLPHISLAGAQIVGQVLLIVLLSSDTTVLISFLTT